MGGRGVLEDLVSFLEQRVDGFGGVEEALEFDELLLSANQVIELAVLNSLVQPPIECLLTDGILLRRSTFLSPSRPSFSRSVKVLLLSLLCSLVAESRPKLKSELLKKI